MFTSLDLLPNDIITQQNEGYVKNIEFFTDAFVKSTNDRWFYKWFGLKDPEPFELVKISSRISMRLPSKDVNLLLRSSRTSVIRNGKVVYSNK